MGGGLHDSMGDRFEKIGGGLDVGLGVRGISDGGGLSMAAEKKYIHELFVGRCRQNRVDKTYEWLRRLRLVERRYVDEVVLQLLEHLTETMTMMTIRMCVHRCFDLYPNRDWSTGHHLQLIVVIW